MIRKKTGFKELTLVVLCGAALVSVACGDDDDTDGDGTSGSAGTTSAGTKSTGGSAGTSSGGTSSAGKGNGGTTSAGTGNGGTSNGGSGNGGSAGSSVGGEPNGGVPSEGGTDGEGGAPLGGANAGGEDAGGAGGEGGAPVVVFDTLKNSSFEIWNTDKTVIAEWTNTATPSGASYFQWQDNEADRKDGPYKLAHWANAAYVARTEQVVSPIANGKYKFSIFVNRDALADLNASYIYAKGYKAGALAEETKVNTDPAVGNPWVEIVIPDVEVSSGEITVGVYTDAKADGWVNIDAASLVRLPD